jgi:hypothetical protein
MEARIPESTQSAPDGQRAVGPSPAEVPDKAGSGAPRVVAVRENDGQVGLEIVAHSPTIDAAGTGVDDHGEEEPAQVGTQVTSAIQS